MARIDPDDIIEGMESIRELEDYFYKKAESGIISKKDWDYIFPRLEELKDYLTDKSGYIYLD